MKLSEQEKKKTFEHKPSEFMRGRRAELYSDSKYFEEAQISKDVFEYHLETLTSRKQEIEFEHFCRRLAEKEICPNLLPQTGPTGGGDSKVDTETYPVADEISERWYEGIGRAGGMERWAFAFSAKEDWHSKVKGDIKKIAKTGRGYKQAFFITNQFVKDSIRADVEAKLEKEHGIPVRILNRSWIMKSVFEHHRLDIAIETLRLEGVSSQSKMILGPNDAVRKAELEELENRIQDPEEYKGLDYQLAEDCLRAAILARGLELPRVEVEGRFERAKRIAERAGIPRQRARILYMEAWTAHWWYDDFEKLNKLYEEVEDLTIKSNQASELERLFNLWQVLNTAVQMGSLGRDAAQIVERTSRLEKALDQLAADSARPTNALEAQALRVFMDITRALRRPHELNRLLNEIKSIITQSMNLHAFPVDPIIRMVRELGDAFAESEEYDGLLETIVITAEQRKSEGEAGGILLKRGIQKFQAGKTYEAIKYFGRARRKFAKDEYKQELVSALVGLTMAYEKAGLLWAARSCVLAAANEIFSTFVKDGKIEKRVLKYLMRMVWLELQLGRIPQALSWMDMAQIVASQVLMDVKEKESYEAQRGAQAWFLGILFLRMDIPDLKCLDFLPNVLDKRGLFAAWLSLLYALGYEDYLRSHDAIPEADNSDSVREMFLAGISGPNSGDLPERSELFLQRKVIFHSYVLGCKVIVELENSLPSIYLAETVLAVLESLLATSLPDFMPIRAQFDIHISTSQLLKTMPKTEVQERVGTPIMVIRHPDGFGYSTMEEREQFGKWLLETIFLIAFHIGIAHEPIEYFEKRFREEELFGRAFDFADIGTMTENTLGVSPPYSMSDWETEKVMERFPVTREFPWYHGLQLPPRGGSFEVKQKVGISKTKGGPPSLDDMKHQDQKVFTIIEPHLWDRAGWQATLFVTEESMSVPPILGLVFKSADAGRQIFEKWQKEIGREDILERIQVSIIRGISKDKPSHYAVFIGMSPKVLENESTGKRWVMASRFHRMAPNDTVNLDRFLDSYKHIKCYLLAPASSPDPYSRPDIYPKLGILKRELKTIDAWQLSENDMEVCVVDDVEDVMVPNGVKDVPLKDAFRRILERRKKMKG